MADRQQQKLLLPEEARTKLREEADARELTLSEMAERLIMDGKYPKTK